MNHENANQANDETDTTEPVLESNVDSIGAPLSSPVEMPDKAKSDTPKRKMALIVASVLLILAIGGAIYLMMPTERNDKTISSTLTDSSEGSRHENMTAAEHLVSDLRAEVTGELQRVDATTEQGGTGAADGVVYSTAAYQGGSQEFAVYPIKAYGFGTANAGAGTTELAANDLAAIKVLLTEKGFTEIVTDSGVFASKNAVCAVRMFGDGNEKTFNGVSVGCGNLSDYERSYRAALPFYTAYVQSKPQSTADLLLSAPVIKDGVDGYRNAYLSMGSSLTGSSGGFEALFYQTPASSNWTFFTGTQNDLSCEIFSTNAIKKAFNGQRCIDASGNETAIKSK